ncbi:MAG: hypothetical protein IMZ50_08010 [Candidatus Atribacteria bacterium]|nr:hypothetical protein [Candidatus Atribacteria bacterium]
MTVWFRKPTRQKASGVKAHKGAVVTVKPHVIVLSLGALAALDGGAHRRVLDVLIGYDRKTAILWLSPVVEWEPGVRRLSRVQAAGTLACLCAMRFLAPPEGGPYPAKWDKKKHALRIKTRVAKEKA